MEWLHARFDSADLLERHLYVLFVCNERARRMGITCRCYRTDMLWSYKLFKKTRSDLDFYYTQAPAGAHTAAAHHNINRLLRMWKLCTVPVAFSRGACTEMMKRIQRFVALTGESWKKQPSKGEQSATRMAIVKGEGGVSGRPGMLKEDKVPARQRSPSPHPGAGFISWAQQERQLGFVPQKPVSLTGFTACCYMPLPICATACESFLSHTLSVSVSSHTVSFTADFLLLVFIFFNSDSSRWSKRRQGWVLNLSLEI